MGVCHVSPNTAHEAARGLRLLHSRDGHGVARLTRLKTWLAVTEALRCTEPPGTDENADTDLAEKYSDVESMAFRHIMRRYVHSLTVSGPCCR